MCQQSASAAVRVTPLVTTDPNMRLGETVSSVCADEAFGPHDADHKAEMARTAEIARGPLCISYHVLPAGTFPFGLDRARSRLDYFVGPRGLHINPKMQLAWWS